MAKKEEKPAAAAPEAAGKGKAPAAADGKGKAPAAAADAKGAKPAAADAKGAKPAAADAKGAKPAAAPEAPAKGKAGGKGAKPVAAAPKKKAKAPPKKLYAVQGNKLSRTKTECPKCGTGYFMAVHYNRRTCGKCSYTQFTDKDGNVRGFGGAPMGGGPSGPMRQSRRLGRAPPAGGGPGPADDE